MKECKCPGVTCNCKKDQTAKQVLTDMITLMHEAGFSIQFNCFSGAYEIVEQDMKLDYALNCAKDCRQ